MTLQSRRERIYSQFPDVVNGYELDPEQGYFSVIIPEATTNLCTNPSVEGEVTTGYAAVGGAMAATYDWQAYGSCGLKLTPAVSTESGFYWGTVALTAATTYTASVTIQGEEGKIYYIWFGSTAGALIGTKRKWIGTGHKQRIWVTTLEPAGASRRVYITRDAQYTDQNLFYADGLQVEAKSYPTTYCDGDQVGFVVGQVAYYWNGTPRASSSTRSAQTRAGGREMSLLGLGLRVLAILGLGMAGVVDQALPIPGFGEIAQGSGTQARQFTLVSSVMAEGSSGRHLQQLRSDLINAFKPDLTTFAQPLILRYQKCDEEGDPQSESLDIICKYTGGLEGNWDNHQQERLALTFKMYMPFIRNTYTGGVELGYQTSVANANYILMRGTDGVWKEMAGGATGGAVSIMVAAPDGSIYIGGDFVNLTDANGDFISKWNGTAFSSLGSGANDFVYALAIDAAGNLYAGGRFTQMGGVANTAYIAKWNGTVWTPLGTGMNERVLTLAIGPDGCLYAGGWFTLAGGVAGTAYVAKWDGANWLPLATGANDYVEALAFSADGTLYAGGQFTNLGSADGDYIAKWDGTAWSALGSGGAGGTGVYDVAVAQDGSVYAAGDFTSMGGVTSAALIARWNGNSWSGLGAGTSNYAQGMTIGPDGYIYVSSLFTYPSGSTFPANTGYWNGSMWMPLDVKLPGNPTVRCYLFDKAGNVYVSFTTLGAATSATVIVPNVGSAAAYPIFYLTGPGSIYQIKNYTTGKSIFFDLTLLAGETAILNLDPMNISFTSSFRGNILNKILPGSDLLFLLLPGNNNISTFFYGSTTAATAITMSWVNMYWSIDGALFQ